jgi:hypothetical protein
MFEYPFFGKLINRQNMIKYILNVILNIAKVIEKKPCATN